MAITVGDAVIKITSDTTGFEKGLADAKGQTQSFGDSISGLASKVLTIAAITAAVVQVGNAFKEATISAIKYGDDVSDMARDLRITTGVVQDFMVAAKLSDIDVGSLINTLRILNVNLGQAAQSGSSAALAIQELGLNLLDLQKMTPDEKLMAIMRALEAMEDPIRRDTLATELLGRGAALAVAKFAELADNMRIAGELGVKFSDPVIQSLDSTNKELLKLGIAWQSMWDRAGAFINTSMGLQYVLMGLNAIISAINNATGALHEFFVELQGQRGDIINESSYYEKNRGMPSLPQRHYIPPQFLASGGLITEPTLLSSLSTGKPYAIAGEAGVETITPGIAGGGFTINVSQLIVREQADVERIARELDRLNKLRGRYV